MKAFRAITETNRHDEHDNIEFWCGFDHSNVETQHFPEHASFSIFFFSSSCLRWDKIFYSLTGGFIKVYVIWLTQSKIWSNQLSRKNSLSKY